MNLSEAKPLVSELAKLFPGAVINQTHAKELARNFCKYDVSAVRHAIREHHRLYTTVDYPKLYETCASPVAAAVAKPADAKPEPSFADIIRQQRPDLAQASDYEVLLRYWQADWHRYSTNAAKRAEHLPSAQMRQAHDANWQGYRTRCKTGCRNNLIAAGMTTADAEAWSETIFSDPQHFRTCLRDLRGDLPAASCA